MAFNIPRWWAATPLERSAWKFPAEPTENQSKAGVTQEKLTPLRRERAHRLLTALTTANGSWIKAPELAKTIFETKGLQFEAALSPDDDEPETTTDRTPAVRDLVAVLRRSGVPIIGGTGKHDSGYRLADNNQELIEYVRGESDRTRLTQEHAKAIALAGARWYPETEQEILAAQTWATKLRDPVVSAHVMEKSQKLRTHNSFSVADQKTKADAAYKQMIASDIFKRIGSKGWTNEALTKQEKDFNIELAEVIKCKKTGKPPRRKKGVQYAWDLRSSPPQK
jgi:hypothetical protein